MSCEEKRQTKKRQRENQRSPGACLCTSGIVGVQKRVIFIKKVNLKMEMVHRTHPSVSSPCLCLHRYTTYVLLSALRSHFTGENPPTPSTFALHLPQTTRDNLEFPIFFLPSFLHSSQPSAISVSCAKAAPLTEEKIFLLLSPDCFPDIYTPLACQVTSSTTCCCLWVNSQGIGQKKKRPFIAWDNTFAVPLPQKLCCPA